VPLRADIGLAGALLTGLLAVVLVAAFGGVTPAIAATVLVIAGTTTTSPSRSTASGWTAAWTWLRCWPSQRWLASGLLVDVLARRGVQVARAETEATGLARLTARTLASRWSPDHDTDTDLLQRCAAPSTWTSWQSSNPATAPGASGRRRHAGAGRPSTREQGHPLPGGRMLTLIGDHLDTPDATLLRAFVAELALIDERQELQRSARASALDSHSIDDGEEARESRYDHG